MSNRYFGWMDFEPDTSTDEIPGKYVLTVGVWGTDGVMMEDLFHIVHRVSDEFPLYGDVAEAKRTSAQHLVDILNTANGWEDSAIDRHYEEALDAFRVIVESARNLLTPDRN